MHTGFQIVLLHLRVSLFSLSFVLMRLLWILLQGNAAYKGKQWNKAVSYYTEAIKLNETHATYYCNRAAAFLELGWFDFVFK